MKVKNIRAIKVCRKKIKWSNLWTFFKPLSPILFLEYWMHVNSHPEFPSFSTMPHQMKIALWPWNLRQKAHSMYLNVHSKSCLHFHLRGGLPWPSHSHSTLHISYPQFHISPIFIFRASFWAFLSDFSHWKFLQLYNIIFKHSLWISVSGTTFFIDRFLNFCSVSNLHAIFS